MVAEYGVDPRHYSTPSTKTRWERINRNVPQYLMYFTGAHAQSAPARAASTQPRSPALTHRNSEIVLRL
eukprot:CAMPEP_0184396620 /NCGR_PEP_ID=MMETSP0007-20130409/53701_1 /TAXON_ID=97485 /ORGANISM="Prymnesium parvum, Strain Texoma1" /LENGTH=68 /DNA_ID=CAMNT_0026749555 /DNA_START=152 /DNA_END=355 /DNA_ORIENTATION=+